MAKHGVNIEKDVETGNILHELIQKHLGSKKMIETEVRKGIDHNGRNVLRVDVFYNPVKTDLRSEDTIGIERKVKNKINGFYKGLFPMITFYECTGVG